jgi:hypothetical protein
MSSEIIFNADSDKERWVMKLTENGILFNRERFPDAKPDDFAQAVIGILEKEFTVKFLREKPPYNRNEKELT